MAGISNKLVSAVRGYPRNDNTTLISGGIQSSLFVFDKMQARQHDDDLDAALRSRGHPGMRLGLNKSRSTARVPGLKAAAGICSPSLSPPVPHPMLQASVLSLSLAAAAF